MAEQSFAELQAQFRSIWPSVTLALGRRSRPDDGRRPLDQLRRAGSAHPGLSGVRRALSLPRPQPSARPEVARHLRDVAADPLARARLLLLARSRARHTRGAKPLRGGLARRRAQRAALPQAARTSGSARTDQAPDRRARDGGDRSVLHDRGRGRSRGGAPAAHLRLRPGTRLARLQDGESAGLRGRGRAPPRRPRRQGFGRSCGRPQRAPRTESRRARGGSQARPRCQRSRERAGRSRCGSERRACGDRARG